MYLRFELMTTPFHSLFFAFMVVPHDTSPNRFPSAYAAEPPQPSAVTWNSVEHFS